MGHGVAALEVKNGDPPIFELWSDIFLSNETRGSLNIITSMVFVGCFS